MWSRWRCKSKLIWWASLNRILSASCSRNKVHWVCLLTHSEVRKAKVNNFNLSPVPHQNFQALVRQLSPHVLGECSWFSSPSLVAQHLIPHSTAPCLQMSVPPELSHSGQTFSQHGDCNKRAVTGGPRDFFVCIWQFLHSISQKVCLFVLATFLVGETQKVRLHKWRAKKQPCDQPRKR